MCYSAHPCPPPGHKNVFHSLQLSNGYKSSRFFATKMKPELKKKKKLMDSRTFLDAKRLCKNIFLTLSTALIDFVHGLIGVIKLS